MQYNFRAILNFHIIIIWYSVMWQVPDTIATTSIHICSRLKLSISSDDTPHCTSSKRISLLLPTFFSALPFPPKQLSVIISFSGCPFQISYLLFIECKTVLPSFIFLNTSSFLILSTHFVRSLCLKCYIPSTVILSLSSFPHCLCFWPNK